MKDQFSHLLLPVVIAVFLRVLLLLILRAARRTARGTRNNIVACVGVRHALRLVFGAPPRRFDFQ